MKERHVDEIAGELASLETLKEQALQDALKKKAQYNRAQGRDNLLKYMVEGLRMYLDNARLLAEFEARPPQVSQARPDETTDDVLDIEPDEETGPYIDGRKP